MGNKVKAIVRWVIDGDACTYAKLVLSKFFLSKKIWLRLFIEVSINGRYCQYKTKILHLDTTFEQRYVCINPEKLFIKKKIYPNKVLIRCKIGYAVQ